MSKEYTLSTLLSELEDRYNATKRPKRYFDVKKRGKLSKKEVSYVKKRFKELVDREKCVKKDPDNPKCYEKVSTDKKPRRKKRRSSYLKDYEEIFGPRKDKSWKETYSSELSKLKKKHKRAPLGLLRIAVETGLPYTAIKEVYDIGVGAYASSGSRPGMSGEQWGYGRVYAFIMSYFFNEDGRYDDQRFFQNKSDFHVLEKIMRKNPAKEDALVLYHTSPDPNLNKIKLDPYQAPFEGVLFFAIRPYGNGTHTYVYLTEDKDFIHVSELFEDYYSLYRDGMYIGDPKVLEDVVEAVESFQYDNSALRGLSFDDLAEILSEEEHSSHHDDWKDRGYNNEEIGYLEWSIQSTQAKIAKILGYKGAESFDEQGSVYMIDMLDGSNKDLVLIDEYKFDEEDFVSKSLSENIVLFDRFEPPEDPKLKDAWDTFKKVNKYHFMTAQGIYPDEFEVEFRAGHFDLKENKLISAMYISGYKGRICMSFDIAVNSDYRKLGLASQLVDYAEEILEDYKEKVKDPEYNFCIYVVSPKMEKLLLKKGFTIYDHLTHQSSRGDYVPKMMRKNPHEVGSCEEDWDNLRDYYTQSFEQNKHDFAELISDLSGKVRGSKPINPRDIKHLGYETRLPSKVYDDQLLTQLMEDIYFRYESNEDLQELANRIKSYNVYGNRRFSDVINRMKHYIPPVFGMPAVQFLTKPFYFVHFTGQYKLELIESRGFKGRSEISTLFSTRESFSEYSYKSGYVYGYLLKSTSHGDALEEVLELATTYNVNVPSGDYDPHWSVTSASFVIAVATKGLEIYHSMDKENQLIVPVSCIEDWSIQTYPRELEDELADMQEGNVEDHYPFDPQEYPEFYGDYEDYDDEDDDDRENPAVFFEDKEFEMDYFKMPFDEVKAEMLKNYPMSVGDPEKFLEQYPKENYNHFHLRNFIFIGPKGQCLEIWADDTIPIRDNTFHDEKLKAIAEAPNVFDFKIPFFVGIVDPFVMDCDEILEFTEKKLEEGDEDLRYDDYLSLTSDDVNNVFFQLRDGNHRTFGVFLSGENRAYALVDDVTLQEYGQWVKKGKPKDDPNYTVWVYLDENLM